MILYFKWRRKIPFTPVRDTDVNNGENVCATSHKIHIFLKFIEIDGISVNLLHNCSKSDCHKHQKF